MSTSASGNSFAINNVRVFDGHGLSSLRTVFVEGGLIATAGGHGEVVDGGGGVLIPGLIDAHVHFDSPENLREFARFGVTTALDMGTNSPTLIDSMRKVPGLTDIRSALSPAFGPSGRELTANTFALSAVVTGPDDAERFVADRAGEGCDYVKIIIEDPAEKGTAALNGETLAALVVAAHAQGFLTIAHASSDAAVQLGINAGVDILTHVPLRSPLTPGQVAAMKSKGIAIVPTLSMMEGIGAKFAMPTQGPGPGIHQAQQSVADILAAGVRIVAGTDANNTPFVPFSPKHGESLHGELQLLVGAGLTPAQALVSATASAAELFRLQDRGTIVPGLRADLVLLGSNPLEDISRTRDIRAVWIEGERVQSSS